MQKKGFLVEVINIETNVTSLYPSLREVAKAFNANHNAIRDYVKSKKLFNKIYYFTIKFKSIE